MAKVKVYCNQQEIATLQLKHSFYIISSYRDGHLFWYGDVPTGEVGVLLVWLQMADSEPRFLMVPPDWQVKINGQALEKKTYIKLEGLKGNQVELQYQAYQFVFDL